MVDASFTVLLVIPFFPVDLGAFETAITHIEAGSTTLEGVINIFLITLESR